MLFNFHLFSFGFPFGSIWVIWRSIWVHLGKSTHPEYCCVMCLSHEWGVKRLAWPWLSVSKFDLYNLILNGFCLYDISNVHDYIRETILKTLIYTTTQFKKFYFQFVFYLSFHILLETIINERYNYFYTKKNYNLFNACFLFLVINLYL